MPIKSLDDLDNTPLQSTVQFSPDGRRYLDLADQMLDDDRYHFAADTITRMRDWIKGSGIVTKDMMQALDNIHVSVRDREEQRGRGSRRYEGYRRW